MATNLPLPVPPLASVNAEEWRAFLNSLTVFANTQIPPIDGQYWVSESNPVLTDEINLGALPSGYLKITTAIGQATPSTVQQIPGGDLTPATVTNAKLANMADATVKGRALGAGTGVPQDLTGAQVAAIIGSATGSTSLVDSLFLMGG